VLRSVPAAPHPGKISEVVLNVVATTVVAVLGEVEVDVVRVVVSSGMHTERNSLVAGKDP
jgi:hypothetical protein